MMKTMDVCLDQQEKLIHGRETVNEHEHMAGS